MLKISRRSALLGATSAAFAAPRLSIAQSGSMLERLRAAKTVRVGIANQLPFSTLNPDGTMTGVAPTMAHAVLKRLGIPNMQGSIATYGELIPGMLAGRWDFVAASLTITKERCAQVLFSDPMSFEGPSIVWLKGRSKERPQTRAELIKLGARVGVSAGGAIYRGVLAAGIDPDKVLQFPTEQMIFDALTANRIDYALTAHLPAIATVRQRKLDVEIVFPVADAPAPGAGNAFRRQDTEFHEAFQTELRALKASGEFVKIANQFGFEIPPDLIDTKSEKLCADLIKG